MPCISDEDPPLDRVSDRDHPLDQICIRRLTVVSSMMIQKEEDDKEEFLEKRPIGPIGPLRVV